MAIKNIYLLIDVHLVAYCLNKRNIFIHKIYFQNFLYQKIINNDNKMRKSSLKRIAIFGYIYVFYNYGIQLISHLMIS